MSTLVSDCPRCDTKRVTFDVVANALLKARSTDMAVFSEAMLRCGVCKRSSVAMFERRLFRYTETGLIAENLDLWSRDHALALHRGPIRNYLKSFRFVREHMPAPIEVPADVPEAVGMAQGEANRCLAAECWNAAGAMYCAVLDRVTAEALARTGAFGLRKRTAKELHYRLRYLFDHGVLPRDLKLLSDCVPPDYGTFGAWFSRADAEDLCDFTTELLRRLYTDPARLIGAVERREKRRTSVG